MAETKWSLCGEYMESCNCDYLCPVPGGNGSVMLLGIAGGCGETTSRPLVNVSAKTGCIAVPSGSSSGPRQIY